MVDPLAPAARRKPERPNIAEEGHPRQKWPPERVAKVDLKPETAIVPSKRKHGALADITVPNQTKRAAEVGTDSNPKHSKRQRQSVLATNKDQIQPKSVRSGPKRPTKVINVYKTTKKTASWQITGREQPLVKDTVTVASSRPTGDLKLPALCPTSGVNGPTDPDQPSQEWDVQEEGLQRAKRKRRELSEVLVEGKSTGDRLDLRSSSEELIRAEDGVPEDLDQEDAADPCMEPEYQVECYQYMRALEVSVIISKIYPILVCTL